MITRKASVADLTQLASLFEAYRLFYKMPPDAVGAEAFIRNRLTQNDSEIFVADADGVLAGFVQLYPLFSSTRMKRLWLLNDLYVDQKFRGHGVSKLLIDASKSLCVETGACALMLETAKSNTIANQLYVATGFELDGSHNYYEWTAP